MEAWLVSAENTPRRWHSWHIAVIALSLCAGCGGSLASSNASTGGASSGGSGAQGGGASSGGSGGAVVSGSACKRTYDHIEFQIVPSGGPGYGCYSFDGGATVYGNWSTTGIVTKTSADSIVVDSCPPDANCVPQLSTVSVKAKGLALSIPVGAIVSVDFTGPNQTQQIYAACSGQLLIKSVGNWGGVQDPKGDGLLYLAAVDGWHSAPAGAPFSVAVQTLACSSSGQPVVGQGFAAPGDYALRFSSAGTPDLVVEMGGTGSFTIAGQKLGVRNLRSFQVSATDAYWDWAYWVAQ